MQRATRRTAAPPRIRADRVSDITTSAKRRVVYVMLGRLPPVPGRTPDNSLGPDGSASYDSINEIEAG